MTEKLSYLHALKPKFGKGFAKDLMGEECLRLFPLKNVNTSGQNGLSTFYCLKSPTVVDICCRFTGDGQAFPAMAFPSNRGLCGGERKNQERVLLLVLTVPPITVYEKKSP